MHIPHWPLSSFDFLNLLTLCILYIYAHVQTPTVDCVFFVWYVLIYNDQFKIVYCDYYFLIGFLYMSALRLHYVHVFVYIVINLLHLETNILFRHLLLFLLCTMVDLLR